ncbi:MAG TPA: LysR family transcriptional regulator [Usitatibacteraceae bacterium]|nr:LysR family transcriptional regulator [Usitatibacteraceae bacterium]
MDKLRAMATFVRIVETGSLTAAAESMRTSLPSVVRGLAELERLLDARLLNRTTRRIALTDEGREYLERAKRVLAEVEEAEAALSARRVAPKGRLRVTASVLFGRLHVAPAVIAFAEKHPAVRVELVLLDRTVDLIEEGIDLGVRIGPLPDSSLVAVPVGATRRVVCASPAYLARFGRPAKPEDVAAHRCVGFTGLSPGHDWLFGEGRSIQRVQVAPVITSNQIDVALQACRDGLGLGQFLCYQVDAFLKSGELVRVLARSEPPPSPVNLVYPGTRHLSSNVRAVVDWLAPRLRASLVASAVPASTTTRSSAKRR